MVRRVTHEWSSNRCKFATRPILGKKRMRRGATPIAAAASRIRVAADGTRRCIHIAVHRFQSTTGKRQALNSHSHKALQSKVGVRRTSSSHKLHPGHARSTDIHTANTRSSILCPELKFARTRRDIAPPLEPQNPHPKITKWTDSTRRLLRNAQRAGTR